ncbi:MAG: SUMF1/EgtB/PvdO family nonheme iron enzyme [Polyangiales bacterium]
MLKPLIAIAWVVSLAACASNIRGGAPRRAASSPRAPLAEREEACVRFPSLSLPDPPSGFPAQVCWRAPLPEGDTLGECPPTMARITGGTLSVLAPEFARRTCAVAPFCMDRSEVTVAEYRACVRAGACVGPNDTVDAVRIEATTQARHGAFCNARFTDREEHPLNCVSWPQAVAYCAWRYGAHGAVPTEDQWAWAARGATERVYPWGDTLPEPHTANRCGASCLRALGHAQGEATVDGEGDGYITTAPVARFPRGDSPFAIHDLAGNVAEWTRSPYGQYRRAPDGKLAFHAEDPALRVVRGGAWAHVEEAPLQIDERAWLLLTDRASWVGFRCVVEAE